jgi:hypothetical protein
MAPHGGTSLVAIAAFLGLDARVLGARARIHQDAASAAERPGLRVHAATFNAGNQRFKREDQRFEELLTELSRGHEDSDLVIFGLQEFGDKDYGFANLAKRTLWKGLSERRLSELNQEILGIAAAPEEVVNQKASLKSYLEDKHAGLDATLSSIDIDGIKQKMKPMQEWTKSALDGIGSIWPRFPNLKYTDEGSTDINRFLHELNRVEHTQNQVAARVQILRALGGGDIADSLHMLDGPEPQTPEDSQALFARNRKVMADWAKLTDVLDELHEEMVAWWDGDEREPWSSDIVSDAKDLLPDPELRFEVDDMDVMFEPVTYDSGIRCSTGSHYDTVLYAFVNPWSEWKIVPEPYSSGKCKHFEEDYEQASGCSIDNNAYMECGKVVNLLRFKATRAGVTMRHCALNTHMSFSGSAEERLGFLEAAMDEARIANCDSVVFVGDFNTRLHCQRGMAVDFPLPPYERTSGSGSSLDYVLDSFKRRDESYALAGSKWQHFDELSQQLANSTVYCYESHKESDGWFGSKTVWTVNVTQSRLPSMGLFEAPVEFGPSYKLGPASKASKAKSHRCVQGMKLCYLNPSGKGKHNPAWTDRVLVQADPQVAQVEVLDYSRHDTPEGFGSDHLPVVGSVVVYPVTK